MSHKSPKQFTITVKEEVANKYSLKPCNVNGDIVIKSPYKKASINAAIDQLLDIYALTLSRSQEEKYLYCSYTSVVRYSLEHAVAILGHIVEEQNRLIAELSATQGSSMPKHSMTHVDNVWQKIVDDNLIQRFKDKKYACFNDPKNMQRIVELIPEAEKVLTTQLASN